MGFLKRCIKNCEETRKKSIRGRFLKIMNSGHDIICDFYSKKMQDSW